MLYPDLSVSPTRGETAGLRPHAIRPVSARSRPNLPGPDWRGGAVVTRRPCRFPSLSPLLAAVRLSVVYQTSPRPRIPRLPPPAPRPLPCLLPSLSCLPTSPLSALPCTPEPAALSAGPIKVARRPGQEPALAHRNRPRAWSPLVCSDASPAPGAQARLAFDQPRPRPSTVPGPALPLGAAHRAGAARRRRRRSSPRPAGPRPSACCRACPAAVHRPTVIRGSEAGL